MWIKVTLMTGKSPSSLTALFMYLDISVREATPRLAKVMSTMRVYRRRCFWFMQAAAWMWVST